MQQQFRKKILPKLTDYVSVEMARKFFKP
jgi:hypothetical protein